MEQHLSIIITALTLISILWAFRDKIFSRGGSEQNVKDRISTLEKKDEDTDECIEEIKKDIRIIKENHLTHIQEEITNLRIGQARVEEKLEILIKR